MSRPRLLDLFCCAGGAAMGYYRAGFDVVGVDIAPQPHYPFEFHQADAMAFPLDGFDAIHASPPCQKYSPLNARVGYRHTVDLVGPIRDRLMAAGIPFVIENVPGAPLFNYTVLCGTMFGLRTIRHRLFEVHPRIEPIDPPRPCNHTIKTVTKNRRAAWDAGLFVSITGDVGTYVGPEAMGIDWMNGNELCQAIPPAYSEYIGRELIKMVQDSEEGAA